MKSHAYWQNEIWQELETRNLDFNYVIIGAGIAGLSAAYWLEKKDPHCRICIIDRTDIGGGASGRNAGFVTCGSAEHFDKLHKQFGLETAFEIWKFSEENRDLLAREIIQDRAHEVDFKITGSCTVAPSHEAWKRYQKIYKDMQGVGIEVELIASEVLETDYGVTGFHGAIQYKHDGYIHPVKLLKLLRSRLERTEFLTHHEVLGVESNPSTHDQTSSKTLKVRLRSDNSGTQKILNAEKVLYCLNGFAGRLLPELSKMVLPQRGQILLTEPLPAFVKGPCYLTKHLCYFRQLPTGELLVGGFRNRDLEAENTDTESTSEKIQEALTEFTQNYFSQTGKNVKIQYRWGGIMGFSPDGQMLIGARPNHPNEFVMAGCSGHGMGLSFHAARVLVDAVFGQTPQRHLNIDRFFKAGL